MHASSLENMLKCRDRFLGPDYFESPRKIVDIGSGDVNGSYRNVFANPNIEYIGVDLAAGPGVDCVLDDPYAIPMPDGTADIVVSGQMLEHCEFFWLAFSEMVRILKPDGRLFLIAPSAGPIHAYPVDCYRFYPDAFRALAKHAGCHCVAVWMDERGPWNDLVGVFSKTAPKTGIFRKALPPENAPVKPRGDALERTSGTISYLEFLRQVHETLLPRYYLEIGVRAGDSLNLANCAAIGIDPLQPTIALSDSVHFIQSTSDDFFDLDADKMLNAPIDLAFIDGMHLFEYALRDFMNIERRSCPAGVIVIDDIFPAAREQGRRNRETAIWMGDIWKLGECLQKYRPDLKLIFIDTAPSGMLLIANLDPDNRVLWRRYNEIVQHFVNVRTEDPPPPVLNRRHATDPKDSNTVSILSRLSTLAKTDADVETVTRALADL